MHSLANFFKLTVLGGALVLLPLAGCVYLLVMLVESVVKGIQPIAELLPVEKLGGVAIANIIAVAAIVGVCFLLGLFVPTALGQGLGRWLEAKVLNLLPGYPIARRIAASIERQQRRVARRAGAGAAGRESAIRLFSRRTADRRAMRVCAAVSGAVDGRRAYCADQRSRTTNRSAHQRSELRDKLRHRIVGAAAGTLFAGPASAGAPIRGAEALAARQA